MDYLKKLRFIHWLRLALVFIFGTVSASAYAYYHDQDSDAGNLTKHDPPFQQQQGKILSHQDQINAMSEQLLEQLKTAQAKTFANNPQIEEQLAKIQSDVADNYDLGALENFANLEKVAQQSKLTDGQKELLGELLVHTQTLVLTRNFSNNPEISGPVWNTIQALQKRDTNATVQNLKVIAEKGKLTTSQQELVTAMLGDYGQHFNQASDMAKSVNDSVETIQSLF